MNSIDFYEILRTYLTIYGDKIAKVLKMCKPSFFYINNFIDRQHVMVINYYLYIYNKQLKTKMHIYKNGTALLDNKY